jgi:NADPH:quinone reductase-like Zn-dependent oxidoreductase
MSENVMQAIAIGDGGAPENLSLENHPMPQPAEGEILVRLGAAGINRGDCMQRMGLYPAPPGAPDIMGLEFAGEIVALGDKVDKWAIGDRIAALVAGGGYAQYACVHQDHALPLPDTMSDTDAAALPETIFTVYANVFERRRFAARPNPIGAWRLKRHWHDSHSNGQAFWRKSCCHRRF